MHSVLRLLIVWTVTACLCGGCGDDGVADNDMTQGSTPAAVACTLFEDAPSEVVATTSAASAPSVVVDQYFAMDVPDIANTGTGFGYVLFSAPTQGTYAVFNDTIGAGMGVFQLDGVTGVTRADGGTTVGECATVRSFALVELAPGDYTFSISAQTPGVVGVVIVSPQSQ